MHEMTTEFAFVVSCKDVVMAARVGLDQLKPPTIPVDLLNQMEGEIRGSLTGPMESESSYSQASVGVGEPHTLDKETIELVISDLFSISPSVKTYQVGDLISILPGVELATVLTESSCSMLARVAPSLLPTQLDLLVAVLSKSPVQFSTANPASARLVILVARLVGPNLRIVLLDSVLSPACLPSLLASVPGRVTLQDCLSLAHPALQRSVLAYMLSAEGQTQELLHQLEDSPAIAATLVSRFVEDNSLVETTLQPGPSYDLVQGLFRNVLENDLPERWQLLEYLGKNVDRLLVTESGKNLIKSLGGSCMF